MKSLSIALSTIALLLTVVFSSIAQDEDHEALFWDSIRNSTSVGDYSAYLQRYPDGVFVGLARNRIEELGGPRQEDALELTRDERRQIQKALLVAGFQPGVINGLFSELTRTAIRSWQASQGLEESGFLDADAAVELIALNEASIERDVGKGAQWIDSDTNAARISASVAHTCAIRKDGSVACWPDILNAARPPGNQDFVSISAGGTHTCALSEEHYAICWGNNGFGEATPPANERLIAISSGGDHTCGLLVDGRVVCWGNDDVGQTLVPSGERLKSISSGVGHSCGLRNDGRAVCWGLGHWDWTQNEDNLVSIDSGHLYICGLDKDGVAVCWSIIDGGEVSRLENDQLFSISVGYSHACGLRKDGSAVCWEFGDGADEGQANAPPSEHFVSISSGTFHTCGMRGDNSVMCWGMDALAEPPNVSRIPNDDHSDGARGATALQTAVDGRIDPIGDIDYFVFENAERSDVVIYSTGSLDTVGSLEPAQGSGFFEPIETDDDGGDDYNFRIRLTLDPDRYFVKVQSFGIDVGSYTVHLETTDSPNLQIGAGKLLSSGWSHTCALRRDGTPVCWGSDDHGESTPPSNEKFVAISSGWRFTCALREDGSAHCWGNNEYGQALPPDEVRFAAISSGYHYVCGLRSDGTPVCWGRNDHGQAMAPFDEAFVSLSSRASHTCGLRYDGSVLCWGRNDDNQASPPPGERFVAIDSGRGYTCGLRADRSTLCWGRFPGGSFTDFISTERFMEISNSWESMCGLLDNGNVSCWTREEYDVSAPSGAFVTIDGRSGHTCGIREEDGSIRCWGNDEYGQSSPPRMSDS